MKIRYTAIITSILVIALMITGLIFKSKYVDFNKQSEYLDNFVVGLMPDELAEVQIAKMEESLDESNIIIAAECVEEPIWRLGCLTEKVKVKQVFKGNGLQSGDVIEVARDANCIFPEMTIDGMQSINMSFVRAMVPGETYLIFLDEKLMLREDDNIYDQSANFLIAPIFCYGETESRPYVSISENGNHEKYKNIKGSEFFLMSEEIIEQMYELKGNLIAQYSLEEGRRYD